MNDDDLEMDALFQAAKASINVERIAAARAPRKVHEMDDAPPAADTLFTNPANWHRTRAVALIHEESQTLLGNFGEWLHTTGARKLVREDGLVQVAGTESVSGSWWVAEHHEIAPAQEWHTKQAAVVDLHFPSLGVHSPACPVIVHLSYGGIARVELEFDTQFGQTEGQPEQLLFLAAGVNVLPVMGQDCKVGLKMELAL